MPNPLTTKHGIALALLAIAFTPVGRWLESSMTSHVLVELPLLVSFGFILGKQQYARYDAGLKLINRGGIFGIIVVSFMLAFWMIPRWLDASLNNYWVAYAKYVSMLTIGILLALSWPKAHPITRAIVKIEFLTMLYRLGWIYLISPERLCNNYLLSDQVWLGRGFLVVGLILAISWLLPVFFGATFNTPHQERKPLLKHRGYITD